VRKDGDAPAARFTRSAVPIFTEMIVLCISFMERIPGKFRLKKTRRFPEFALRELTAEDRSFDCGIVISSLKIESTVIVTPIRAA